ncbi:MAG: TIGR03435 family protein [Acidobacteriota bacterium]
MSRITFSLATVSLSLLLAASGGRFKAQAQTVPKFAVVSIRPHPVARGVLLKPWSAPFQCPPDDHCGLTGNLFREISVSLADLIMDAYRVKKYQILGLPSWGASGSDLYDLNAKVPDDVTATVNEARLMLQSVLADRFQLRIHHETREMRVYALVARKNSLKVLANQSPCGVARKGRSAAQSSDDAPEYHFPWDFFAQVLSIHTDRPVIDESGLEGVDFCTADGQSPQLAIALEMERGASVFTAVEDKWGMRLEPRNAQVDVLVIESVMRPSEN